VTVLDDSSFGDQRTLRLLVSSPRAARVAWITVEKARVLEAAVNGKRVPNEGFSPGAPSWRLTYVGLPRQGVVLTLTVSASEAPVLKVIDQSERLPDIPGITQTPRPDDLMPSPRVLFDSSTLVSKTFERFQMTHTMAH
jgi:hypothetical protein